MTDAEREKKKKVVYL